MHNLPVLHILARDRFKDPANIFCSGKHVHTRCLHARADLIHMPAFTAHAFVHHSRSFLSNTVLVLAINTGIPSKAERLVKTIIKSSLFQHMHSPVYPDYQVPEPVMEVIRDIIRAKRSLTGHAVEPKE